MSATKADHVVTVSETTRLDVISHLGIPPSKVTNVYQSVDVASSVSGLDSSILAIVLRDTFGLEWKQYYLHYGNIEPKKNLGRIVEAYSQSLTQKKLVIVGGKGWLQDNEVSLLNEIRSTENPLSNRIVYLDYLPHATLATLITGARATLFPSLYEGFGLPIIESMALGTAVLTTNFGAPREIAGQSALLVDPFSVRSIKEGILALENDETVLSMASRGTERAARFEPVRIQSSLKEVYEHVIQTCRRI
jgi:glycosyltransferase involved in cell wall biosynthesis